MVSHCTKPLKIRVAADPSVILRHSFPLYNSQLPFPGITTCPIARNSAVCYVSCSSWSFTTRAHSCPALNISGLSTDSDCPHSKVSVHGRVALLMEACLTASHPALLVGCAMPEKQHIQLSKQSAGFVLYKVVLVECHSESIATSPALSGTVGFPHIVQQSKASCNINFSTCPLRCHNIRKAG